MPYKSEAQRRYLEANHPQVAQDLAAHTPPGAELPERLHPPKADPKRRRQDAIRRKARMGTSPGPEAGARYAEVS